ncbi:unnamed protein product [Danaus chrysippus]|uniref:(African queen) hypothetical protein n=1 Tax=Danaus chrysippus TaxID=151541 RepID=A0A8J2R3S8_9NEOP|nr:unnamed protein product [Danaus chrysippus]
MTGERPVYDEPRAGSPLHELGTSEPGEGEGEVSGDWSTPTHAAPTPEPLPADRQCGGDRHPGQTLAEHGDVTTHTHTDMHPTDRHGALELNLNNDLMKTIQELCCHGGGFTVDRLLHGRTAASDSEDEEQHTAAQLQQNKPLLKFSVSAILGEDVDHGGPGGEYRLEVTSIT